MEPRIGVFKRDLKMTKQNAIGTTLIWTIKTPNEQGGSMDDYNAFVDDFLGDVSKDAFIKGKVVYNDGESAIMEIEEMTPSLFPFTLFYNEVKNRFPDLESTNDDPYRKYLCLDIASMTSLFYYDEESGYLANAEYNDDGSFCSYDLPDGEDDLQPEMVDGYLLEGVAIQLPQEEIEEYESKEAFCSIGDMAVTDEDGNLIPSNHPCSIVRAKNWFNTRDCAILTAWRSTKTRKTNDDNNRKLQKTLRDLGYGVTKITGWYPEKDKELARENSFLTVNLNEEKDFRDNIFKLSEHYEQDCFLYKEAGHEKPALYVYTNDDCGKGKVELLGRLRIGNMDAEAFSQIKAGRITFE